MFENPQNQVEETISETKPVYATQFEYQSPAVQVALFVLWRIHNKHYQTGARLFYDEIKQYVEMDKRRYNEALLFLEGASVAVNEVIVADKVNPVLVQRYGILEDGE